MKEKKPISVRLDDDLKARTQRAARKMGLGDNVSAIIKLSLAQQLPDIEAGLIRLNAE